MLVVEGPRICLWGTGKVQNPRCGVFAIPCALPSLNLGAGSDYKLMFGLSGRFAACLVPGCDLRTWPVTTPTGHNRASGSTTQQIMGTLQGHLRMLGHMWRCISTCRKTHVGTPKEHVGRFSDTLAGLGGSVSAPGTRRARAGHAPGILF